jgi:hypothetical protein
MAAPRLLRAGFAPGRLLTPVVLALCLAACSGGEPGRIPAGAHAVQDPALAEMSGLVASHRQPGVLWSINDSGSFARLYRLGSEGQALGRVWVSGAWLHDTETLARWRRHDRDWLLIGDVGDNRARRDHVVVHAVPEPDTTATHARIAWSLRFRYPDGPRDAEGIAVDQLRGELLVLSKRDQPARLYRVPLAAGSGKPVTADYLGSPRPGALEGAVTGLDLSDDGRELAVLTYTGLYLWRRGADEAWPQVLQRAPVALPRPTMHKAEAMALAATAGTVLVGSEKRPTPLWVGRYSDSAGPTTASP